MSNGASGGCVRRVVDRGNGKKKKKEEGTLNSRRFFFFKTKNGIRYQIRSRGLGDVYKSRTRVTRLDLGSFGGGGGLVGDNSG